LPGPSRSLTDRVVGSYDPRSLSARARTRRWRQLAATFPEIGSMSVLDLGGDARAWRLSGLRPAHVTLLNVVGQEVEEAWMSAEVGDACDPPRRLLDADLIYSNSVIEHVGGHWRRQRFAEAVRSAPRYWVQTPNRHFPIEPHFMIPLAQYLPPAAQARLIVAWPLGNYAALEDREVALRRVLDIELLTRPEMALYFPDAEIRTERALGMTKSFIAVKTGRAIADRSPTRPPT
jgi:hypothetical protein